MWDSPSWIGTAIRSKVDERIASFNRASNEGIAEANRQSNEFIASQKIESDKVIAEANRLSNERINAMRIRSEETIASLNRSSEELIARERNAITQYGIDVQASTAAANRLLERDLTERRIQSNELIAQNELSARREIAAADRLSREVINEANIKATANIESARRALTASEGDKNRENQIEIAKMNITQRVISDGVRLIPLVVNASDFHFKDPNSKGPTASSARVSLASETSNNAAKKKADDLFPNLEPTFKSSTMAAGAAVLLSMLSGVATFVPFI